MERNACALQTRDFDIAICNEAQTCAALPLPTSKLASHLMMGVRSSYLSPAPRRLSQPSTMNAPSLYLLQCSLSGIYKATWIA